MGYILLNKSSTKARAGLRWVRRFNPHAWRQPAWDSWQKFHFESSCFILGREDALATIPYLSCAFAIYSTKRATVHVPSVRGVLLVSGNIADKHFVVGWRQISTLYYQSPLFKRGAAFEICIFGSAGDEYWPCEFIKSLLTFEAQGWHCGSY